jgi:hypothetical protein
MPKPLGNRVVASTADDLRFKAKRIWGIDYKIIACIDCGAAIGEPCIASTGKPLAKAHVARLRLANRHLQEVARLAQQVQPQEAEH